MTYKEKIIKTIEEKCIYKPKHNKLMLGKLPGARYQMQFYLSNAIYSDTEFLQLVAIEFDRLLGEAEVDLNNIQITGKEWSSIPLIISLSQFLGINSFLIRSSRKSYGKHNFIEGIPNDKKVVIVDMLCNSTNSFYFCEKICETQSLKVVPLNLAILNKYSRKEFGNTIDYDRHSGKRCLSICERDDLNVT